MFEYNSMAQINEKVESFTNQINQFEIFFLILFNLLILLIIKCFDRLINQQTTK